ncbi:DNA-binding protein K10 [Episyrphus balteatus]|uniref:DNA-binding protein K10 n=1 Tax=Episyrphus balteatus TaxID=286459 RepID=UPI00248586AC|nr:DNA-binding protein K10 [Episyrphus balteatus]
MVSKSGYMPTVRRQNLPRAAKMFKQNSPMNGPNGLNAMFNASQIPDNPGYMDFNNPTPPIAAPNSGINKKMTHATGGRPQRNMMPPPRNIGEPHRNNWSVGRNGRGGAPMRHNHPKFGGGGGGNRQFNGMNMPRRPMPPIPPMPMRGPMPPIPIDPMANHFNVIPPMMRNNMVGVRPGPPLPPIPPPMMRRSRNAPPPPMRRGNNAIAPSRIIKHRRNGKPIKAAAAAASVTKSDVPSKKTLKEIINQYPLDKPWVTEEIRQEHNKKENIENRLKGKKNDELFAAFKVQRDKFVALYEAARTKHLEDTKSKDNETEPDKKNR